MLKKTIFSLLQVIFALAVSCKAQWLTQYMGPIEQRLQDAAGNQGFAYFDWNQNRQETWMRDGSVIGQYSYIDAKGMPVVTYYDAGTQGFRVKSNNLPEAPAVRLSAPMPVKETPEVAEARSVMEELHKKAASRNKREADPQWMHPIQTTSYPLIPSNPAIPMVYSSPFPVNPWVSPYSLMMTNPWIKTEKAEGTVEKTRLRREADPMWPTTYAMPSMLKAKVETKQLIPVEGRTPADTTKLQLTTTQREVPVATLRTIPTIGWQSTYSPKPITNWMNPIVMHMPIV